MDNLCKRKYHVRQTDEVTKITDRFIAQKIFTGLSSLWKSQSLCDVTLQVQDVTVPAHKLVLSIHSPYFKVMFTAAFDEQKERQITITSLSPDTLSTILEYMYTGVLTVTKSNVQDLLVAADMLQMSDAKTLCSTFMEDQIASENCLGLMQFALCYGCTKLYDKCVEVTKQRFLAVSHNEEFLTLSTDTLIGILQYQDLSLGHLGESAILAAVIRWLEHEPALRISDLSQVLQHVKLKCVPEEERQRFMNTTIVRENKDVMLAVDEQLCSRSKQNSRRHKELLYVIGGYLQSRTGPLCPRLMNVERLNPEEESWSSMDQLPLLPSGIKAFNLYGRLFCVAYKNPQTVEEGQMEKGFYEFVVVQNRWKDVSDCFSYEAREALISCLVNLGAITHCAEANKIYAVGNSEVSSIDIQLDDGEISCQNVTTFPLPQAFVTGNRRNYSAVVCHKSLYVLGGEEKYSLRDVFPTADVYVYDFDEKRWITRASMKEPRSVFQAVELNGFIYAIGGYNYRRLRTMEKYDSITDTWQPVSPMGKERSHFGALVLEDRIYAMGGKSYAFGNGGARKVLNTCEVYNPSNDSWQPSVPMRQARCTFAAVVL